MDQIAQMTWNLEISYRMIHLITRGKISGIIFTFLFVINRKTSDCQQKRQSSLTAVYCTVHPDNRTGWIRGKGEGTIPGLKGAKRDFMEYLNFLQLQQTSRWQKRLNIIFFHGYFGGVAKVYEKLHCGLVDISYRHLRLARFRQFAWPHDGINKLLVLSTSNWRSRPRDLDLFFST